MSRSAIKRRRLVVLFLFGMLLFNYPLTERPEDMGIGLPISRQIIEHLGGRLWVRSDPGASATLEFVLTTADGIAARRLAVVVAGDA